MVDVCKFLAISGANFSRHKTGIYSKTLSLLKFSHLKISKHKMSSIGFTRCNVCAQRKTAITAHQQQQPPQRYLSLESFRGRSVSHKNGLPVCVCECFGCDTNEPIKPGHIRLHETKANACDPTANRARAPFGSIMPMLLSAECLCVHH